MACAIRAFRCSTLARAPAVRVCRPAGLTSSFVSASAPTGMFSRSFTGFSLTPVRKVVVKTPLTIVAGGNSLGNTCDKSNRHSKRVSGFKARMATPTGRRVLRKRRAKGRALLCTASLRKNGKTRV